jgi:hypothetical protein
VRKDAERFLTQGVLGGFVRGTILVREFAEQAAERLQRILKDRPDSRWKPFTPHRTSAGSHASPGKYLSTVLGDGRGGEWDLYVSASIEGRCLGRKVTVSIGLWHIPDLASDCEAVLYTDAWSTRSLEIPRPPRDHRRVQIYGEYHLCLVPSKSIDLDRGFRKLLDELLEMLPSMLGRAA